MKSIIILYILLMSRTLFASPLEEIREILMFKTNNYDEFAKYNQYYLKMEDLINSCKEEIRNNKFPQACFKSLLAIKRLKLKSTSIGVSQKQIDEFCIKRSKTIENLGVIDYFLQNKGLSLVCRDQLENQKKVLEYILISLNRDS
jgi:hypothetical protein